MEYISPISSAVMAVIWIVYFQLFLIQYQRNNRPYMVIHHAQNENPDALCLLVNMGKETIHVQCVQVVLQTRSGEERTLTVTEYRRVGADDSNVHQVLRQGPLQPGGYLVLGSFRNIILGRRSDDSDSDSDYLFEDVTAVEIRAAVVHGPSRYAVGVRRRFWLRHDGASEIFPAISTVNSSTAGVTGMKCAAGWKRSCALSSLGLFGQEYGERGSVTECFSPFAV